MSFSYLGTVPASKSLYNRLLICQSYFPGLQIEGKTKAEDVTLMKKALQTVALGVSEVECGYAGTVFRFLALKLARLGGEWQLNVQPELRNRPHDGLFQILGQLCVDYKWNNQGLSLKSDGWKLQGDGLHVSMQTSSQFLSGVLLNSWGLEKDLFISVNSKNISVGYFEMTLKLVRALGLSVERNDNELIITSGGKVQKETVYVEPDMSSAFALAAVAAVNGDATFQNFPDNSLQPDSIFVEILEKMGVFLEKGEDFLKVRSGASMKGLDWSIESCPDLFPSLATLCCLAAGTSSLFGAPHLKFKESDRIGKTVELLEPLGRNIEVTDGGLKISGGCLTPDKVSRWSFNPDKDHRMAMAAAILLKAGYPIEIQDQIVVNKSFPEFWNILGVAS